MDSTTFDLTCFKGSERVKRTSYIQVLYRHRGDVSAALLHLRGQRMTAAQAAGGLSVEASHPFIHSHIWIK